MLTAKGDEVDRIVGLEMGADDYLAQAVQPARTARPHPCRAAPPAATPPGRAGRRGRRSLRQRRGRSRHARADARGEELLPLTTGEFAVLKVLLSTRASRCRATS
jgi:DNA-binding response OmpR family regulator